MFHHPSWFIAIAGWPFTTVRASAVIVCYHTNALLTGLLFSHFDYIWSHGYRTLSNVLRQEVFLFFFFKHKKPTQHTHIHIYTSCISLYSFSAGVQAQGKRRFFFWSGCFAKTLQKGGLLFERNLLNILLDVASPCVLWSESCFEHAHWHAVALHQ